MKQMHTKLILILAAISLFVIGCRTAKLTPDPEMKYFYEIDEGDELTINWKFNNAHRVKIEGFEGSFLPEGHVTVKPEKSREYQIMAYKGFSDSLKWTVYVDVFAKQAPEEVKTGDVVLQEPYQIPSYSESEFLNGIIDEQNSTGPNELRVVRVKKDNGTNAAEVYSLLLDNLGNFVSGYGFRKDSVIWNTTNTCGGVSANYSRLDFEELTASIDKEFVDFAILIDNSIFSNNADIKESTKSFIRGMNQKDKVMVSFFNHRYQNIIGLMSPELALEKFDDSFVLPEKNGFNASYEAVCHSIDALKFNGTNKNRALVLITYSNDNASLNKKIEDIVRKAELCNVSIFVIGIGNNIKSQVFRNITSSSGGKYYILFPDEINNFGSVLSEILFTYRNSYKITIPTKSLDDKCKLTKSVLSFSDLKKNLSTTIYYSADIIPEKNKSIITAGFKELSLTIDKSYFDNLNKIASFLKTSDKTYNLTGYSYDEGNREVSENFAFLRADVLKDYFVGKGVHPNRIIVKIAKPDFPMFTTVEDNKLMELNRRVDLSEFIEQYEKKDYELNAGRTHTETESQELMMEWEQRGYKAYYVRVPDNHGIAYDIKLWGFKNRQEAEKAVREIKRKYKKEIIIE